MTRLTTLVALCACLAAGLSGTAFAQGTGAPAGRDPVTAPGGTEGLAGPGNEAEAIRSREAVPVPPGTGGVPVEEAPMPPRQTPMEGPPPRP